MSPEVAEYFLPEVPTFDGCQVTPLLDGVEHSAALLEALDDIGTGGFVLLAGWWLGLARGRFELVPGRFGGQDPRMSDVAPYCLDPWPDPSSVPFVDPPEEKSALLEVLAEKVRQGVDVRVLGWVSPTAVRHPLLSRLGGAAHAVAINRLTLRSLRALRAVGATALPSTVGHLAGSSHSKLALVGDSEKAVGFTGGLDLELSRWSRLDHSGRQTWHDVVVRVEGPAVQSIYDHFRIMWEANLAGRRQVFGVDGEKMVAVPAGTPVLPVREIPVRREAGSHLVQGLRTLPAARYRRLLPISRPHSLPTAPNGSFTYREALARAIGRAREYIYLEDPLLWSWELMTWVNAAVRREPGLRVVILTGGLEDPNDPPLPHSRYICQALNHGLLDGLDEEQRARVAAFRRTGVVVHAKTVLVDDVWACIGSCNLAQRSLYTDIEHGFSFGAVEGSPVADYRARLWGHHLGLDSSDLAEQGSALAAWKAGGSIEELVLPVEEVPFSSRERRRYEDFHDPDSRRPWFPRPL